MRAPLTVLLLALVAAPAMAQVYKCTEGGKIVFSDYPCQRTDNRTIDVRPAAGGPVNRSSEYWADQERREKAAAAQQEAEIQRELRSRPPLAMPVKAMSPEEERRLIDKAKRAVLYQLIDPESGRFRNVSAKGGEVCGEVNGKNRMGGYAGFQAFWVKFDPEPEVWMGDILGPSAERVCSRRIAESARGN